MDADFVAYTDGGYVMAKNIGASACVILSGPSVYYRWSKACRNQTNNRQELGAIIHAVMSVPNGGSLLVVSDSDYSINVLRGRYKAKSNLDLISVYNRLCKERGVDVSFEWVKGHADNPWNNYADALCTEAIERALSGGEREWESREDCYYPLLESYYEDGLVGEEG